MNIIELEILTANFEQTMEFYSEIMELEIDKNIIMAGDTNIRIVESDDFTPYHLAFNISYNKMADAKFWLEERVDLLSYQGEEIVDYKNWQAKSLYFLDPDENVIELIGRQNTPYNEEGEFSGDDIYEVSEIGLASRNVEETSRQLIKEFDLPKFSGNLVDFAALGDDSGLFILVPAAGKTWVPSNIKSQPAYFSVTFSQNGKEHSFEYKSGKIIL